MKPVGTNGRFISSLIRGNLLSDIAHITISICNSLSLANGNRRASVTVVVNLTNGRPTAISVSDVPNFVHSMRRHRHLLLTRKQRRISFPHSGKVHFRGNGLPLRRGNVRVRTCGNSRIICDGACCSVNNNFVISRRRFNRSTTGRIDIPCPFGSTARLLTCYGRANCSLSNLTVRGRLTLRDGGRVSRCFTRI